MREEQREHVPLFIVGPETDPCSENRDKKAPMSVLILLWIPKIVSLTIGFWWRLHHCVGHGRSLFYLKSLLLTNLLL